MRPSDGISLVAGKALPVGDVAAVAREVRRPGEVTRAKRALGAIPGVRTILTLAGPRRQGLPAGASVATRLDPAQVPEMPLRSA